MMNRKRSTTGAAYRHLEHVVKAGLDEPLAATTPSAKEQLVPGLGLWPLRLWRVRVVGQDGPAGRRGRRPMGRVVGSSSSSSSRALRESAHARFTRYWGQPDNRRPLSFGQFHRHASDHRRDRPRVAHRAAKEPPVPTRGLKWSSIISAASEETPVVRRARSARCIAAIPSRRRPRRRRLREPFLPAVLQNATDSSRSPPACRHEDTDDPIRHLQTRPSDYPARHHERRQSCRRAARSVQPRI